MTTSSLSSLSSLSLFFLPTRIQIRNYLRNQIFENTEKHNETFYSVECFPNRIGNFLCEYFTCISYQLSMFNSARIDFNDLNFKNCKNFKYLSKIPRQINIKKFKIDRKDLIFPLKKNKKREYFDHKKYSQWELLYNDVLFGISPVISKILMRTFEIKTEHNLPIQKHKIVIHLRMSDSPFNRHRSYHFMKLGFFDQALDIINKYNNQNTNKFDVLVLCNFDHRRKLKNKNICQKYLDLYVKYLASHRFINKVTTRTDGTVEQDFREMLSCRYLVSTGSSMSMMAALGKYYSQKSINIFPTPIHQPIYQMIHQPIHQIHQETKQIKFINNQRIHHSRIKNYNNVIEVWNKIIKL